MTDVRLLFMALHVVFFTPGGGGGGGGGGGKHFTQFVGMMLMLKQDVSVISQSLYLKSIGLLP